MTASLHVARVFRHEGANVGRRELWTTRARERRGDARAVSIGSNETFRWIRAMRARAMAREGRGWGRWMSRDAMDERDD